MDHSRWVRLRIRSGTGSRHGGGNDFQLLSERTVYLSGPAVARAGFAARSRHLLFDLRGRRRCQRRRCFLCFYLTLYVVASRHSRSGRWLCLEFCDVLRLHLALPFKANI